MTAGHDPKLLADILVNLFGALGALVVAYTLRRSDPLGPVTRRAVWALGIVAALFLARCLAWGSGSEVLAGLVDILAGLTPLLALVAAEGLLRRHAPRPLKLAILGGAVAIAVVVLLPRIPNAVDRFAQLVVVAGGFGAVGVFLWRRDPATLTEGENAAIRRALLAMVLLVPLIATDFRSIWPDLPMRLGAVGALIVLFVAFGPSRGTASERLLALGMFGIIAGLFALGYLKSGHGEAPGQAIRATAVGLSGLIFAALFSEALGTGAERRRPADPLLAAATPADFAQALRTHRLLGQAVILRDEEVAPLRHPVFDALIDERPVLRQADAPWGRGPRNEAVERARSLFMTYEATHIVRLSREPMRLAVFALPQISADARTESEIAAAQRIGELIFSREGRA